MLDGSRRLLRLFNSLGDEEWDDELFGPIEAFESETEDLPVGELRSLWNREALAARDAKAAPYLKRARVWIHEVCRGLIDKYGEAESRAAEQNPQKDW